MKKFYVCPTGKDDNEGSKTSPFGSLQKALEAVASLPLPADEESEKVDIILKDGVHRLDKTLNITRETCRDGKRAITIEAENPGSATLSSGYVLSGWQKLAQVPQDVPVQFRGNIWTIDLPAGSEVNTLYGPQGLIPRARGKAIIPQNIPGAQLHDRFLFEEGDIHDYADIAEAEALIIPSRQWTMNILPIKSVDMEKCELLLAENCTYEIGIPHCAPDGSIWIENSLGVISPGSWVYHKSAAKLYYCPEGDKPEENLEAALLTEFIRIEGEYESDGELKPVSNVTIQNINFTHSRRFSFHGLTGKGIQHDWEMHDAPSAMLRLRHAHHCVVEGCRFEHGGSAGVRLDLASRYNRVTNNSFTHLGGCGVLLCGYGPSRKYLNRDNEVCGNSIHHIGEFYWHSPAIFIWQSGNNTIAENHLHDLPYTGIVCSCRAVMDREGKGECSKTINWEDVENQCGVGYQHTPWHYSGITDWWTREPLLHSRENLIEYNRIHDVMLIMGDGNGIYLSGGGGGNLVRFNIIGPCPSQKMNEGIRCDNDQHHTIIHGNLIFALGGWATGITLKGINRVTNNILACPVVDRCFWGMLSLETGPLNGSVIQRNVFLTETPEQKFVSGIRIHGEGRRALQRDTESDFNLYYCLGDPGLGESFVEQLRQESIDTFSLGVDPCFVDAKNGDFNLKPVSPLFGIGFQSLPLEKMFSVGKSDH
ncbi:MAG: hypothetical protein E4H27_05095 [Anaerolineales bacterium]|nr:MAG: hypothetical protein E4H27_05095 [Anaerolineales bacterium]